MDGREGQATALYARVRACQGCTLARTRTNAVPGEGPLNAELMFIGEAPGQNEDRQGRPFVGAAGSYLEELLGKINLKRTDVFITNVVKCRPPNNRDPLPDELAACSDYLERQIQVIIPKVIVTLGRYSMARFLPNAKISDVHGQAYKIKGRLVVPMFHPAAALHQPSLKISVERDFARLPELIAKVSDAEVVEVKPPEDKSEPTQLSLF